MRDHPLGQLADADVFGEPAEGGGDPFGIGGLDPAVQLIDALHRVVGVRFDKEHRHRNTGPALDQPLDAGADLQAAGDQDAGDIGVGRGDPAGQAGDNDIRAVARGDDQAALLDVFEKVADLHRRKRRM